jgi:hypothetical protein
VTVVFEPPSARKILRRIIRRPVWGSERIPVVRHDETVAKEAGDGSSDADAQNLRLRRASACVVAGSPARATPYAFQTLNNPGDSTFNELWSVN